MLFRFANPEYLYFLLIIPVLVGWYIYTRINRKRQLKKFGDIELLKELMPGVSNSRQIIKFSLMLLACHISSFLIRKAI